MIMLHGNKGRKQTSEQIRKRMESVAKSKAMWTPEHREEVINHHRIANKKLANDPLWREKNSDSHLGKIPWNKGKKCPQYSGSNHWNWGNNMPQESIEKMRKSLTGKKQSPELIKKRVDARAGYSHSDETKAKIRDANRGEKNGMFNRIGPLNPMWKGGLSFEPYPTTWTFGLREAIRKRDGRKCFVCGIEENGKRHDVHHIDYDKRNIESQNLITLCIPCHRKTNYHRGEWKQIFLMQPHSFQEPVKEA